MLAGFILLLWVLLVAMVDQLKWFVVDDRLIGFVGVAFVVAAVLEMIFGKGNPTWPFKRG